MIHFTDRKEARQITNLSPRNDVYILLNSFLIYVVEANVIIIMIMFSGAPGLQGGDQAWHPESHMWLGLGTKSTQVKVRKDCDKHLLSRVSTHCRLFRF